MQTHQEPILRDAANLNFGEKPRFASKSSFQPPEHLSEFYSFMSSNSNIQSSPSQGSAVSDFEYRKGMNREPSLNTFTSFSPSVNDLSSIMTSKDFQSTINKYDVVLDKAAKLREALLSVSEAASEFGEALDGTIQDCPKVNNSKSVSNGLINAGGLQHIIGANQHILSRLILLSFETPLRKELTNLKAEYESNHSYYQQEVKAKSRKLREKELQNLKLSKSKTRNLNTYKNNLMNLTNQVDEIDRLKYDYYHEINSMIENFNQKQLLIKTGSLVRAQLEIYEGIAKKGWSGGGLDELLEVSPDIFGSNDNEEEVLDQIADNTAAKRRSITRVHSEDYPHTKLINDYVPDEDTTLELVDDEQTPNNRDAKPLNRSIQNPVSKEKRKSLLDSIKENKDTGVSEDSQDESFSLPIINHNNTVLSQRSKMLDSGSSKGNSSINNDNILTELDN